MTQLFTDKDPAIVIHTRPAWMSPDLWATLTAVMENKKLICEFAFSKAEKKVLRKRKTIRV